MNGAAVAWLVFGGLPADIRADRSMTLIFAARYENMLPDGNVSAIVRYIVCCGSREFR